MKINEMIKELRIKYNLTQKQLAAILGCHYQVLQRWEYGTANPSSKYLLKLLELSKD
jgi:DNA-binding transcriptional regulator YiaG